LITSPAGRKKLVPASLSSNRRTPAASKTAKANRLITAVVSHPQHVSGIRSSDMPRVRISSTVVMKLIAPISEPAQKRAILTTHSVIPWPMPGPAIAPAALRGGYAVHPEIGAPPSTTNAEQSTRNDSAVVQNDSMFNRGNAMSGAPICRGRK
jgi:hypothetical protein